MPIHTSPIKSFRDLIVWQKSVALVTDVYHLTSHFPRDERFGATAQFRRAAMSIPLNIAEGHGRTTRGEYRNQLSVASGSVNEVLTLCAISANLGFAELEPLERLEGDLTEVQRMVIKLIARLGKG